MSPFVFRPYRIIKMDNIVDYLTNTSSTFGNNQPSNSALAASPPLAAEESRLIDT